MTERRVRTRTRTEESPARVVRVRNKPQQEKKSDLHKRLDGFLQTISECDIAAANAAERKARAEADLYALMKKFGINQHRFQNMLAERGITKGRDTSVIDPKKFHDACESDKDFYSAITVGIQKARTVLPMKTLDNMTTTIPGRVGEDTVKVTYEKERK